MKLGNRHRMHCRHLPSAVGLDFQQTPFVAIWEVTRACDLACRHCRAEAITQPLPGELTTEEGFELLEQLATMGAPICVLTGGDPAGRPDLCALVRRGVNLGMRMATIPAATRRLTRDLVRSLREAGLAQMALSLDGPTAEVHDHFRGVPGAFEITLKGARYALEEGLPLQINTTLCGLNRRHFNALAELVQRLGVVFWEVFFLVPIGRGRRLESLTAREFEEFFRYLASFVRSVDFTVKVTEAPHYRRYLLQQSGRQRKSDSHPASESLAREAGHSVRTASPADPSSPRALLGLAPQGVNAGNGHLFVSCTGDISPSGFLPLACGNVRRDSVARVYRRHPLFRRLRSPDLLKGKCGRCEFRHVCGGSRARAFAATGDYLAEEPCCPYEPAARPVFSRSFEVSRGA